jgi:pseurotin biosynthesis cytochrome P450 monooxygenase
MDDEAAYTLYSLIKSPTSFDDHFMRYSYSVLTSSLLGFSIPSATDPYIHHNERFTDEVIKAFRPDCFPINVFPFLKSMPFWLIPSLKRMESLRKEYIGQMWSFRSKMVKSVKSGLAKESIYKHFVLNRGDYAVTDEESIHAFQAMIDGGTRPPHNALLSFLYLMMEYPEWQKKLQKEVDETLSDGSMPSFKDIPKLPTVRAVVKETIRYRSIMAEVGMLHQLEDDDIYEGLFFEKGTIFYATFA